MSSLRPSFAESMEEIAAQDSRLVVVVGDISHGLLSKYRERFPDRYFNIGICEPATLGVAAGLSKTGLIPVVHTIAPFLIERSYEQIKLDFGYQALAGNFISVGSAFDYSKLGCSHHSYADVSLMSHIENSQVFLPGSPAEFNQLFKASYNNGKINYFKLTENGHEVVLKPEEIIPGKGIHIKNGSDLYLITTGAMLGNCLEAARELELTGISAGILYFHTLKPFDQQLSREVLSKVGKFVVVEELSDHDGLFNLVTRTSLGLPNLSGRQLAIQGFIRSYGKYEDLLNSAGLSVKHIITESREVVEN
jgi:transketolase